MKTIDTLVKDIYNTLEKTDTVITDEQVQILSSKLSTTISERLCQKPRKPAISMSQVGKPLRKLWYDINEPDEEPLDGQTRLKFLYGDILETLLLWLCTISGHTVEDEQKPVEINGIKGSMDAKIDGVVVDVKSAASYSFNKFKNRTLSSDDAFGYLPQLSGYAKAEDCSSPAFLAINKETAEIVLYTLDPDFDVVDIETIIDEAKETVKKSKPPEEKCYQDIEDGASGNRKLGACKYCPHKFKCWEGLRAFSYSNETKYLTVVNKEPQVPEILHKKG